MREERTMYLAELRIWNFRKYGIQGDDFEKAEPGVSVSFQPGLNVLIGENDSGKTAIVDAIRFVLGTQSREWLQVAESDFYNSGKAKAEKLKIECVFRGFTHKEAAPFLEWLNFEENSGSERYALTVRFTARRTKNRIITDLRAGADSDGAYMDGEARELIRVTFLKPLRDAENELTPGRRSRLAQILKSHSLFQKDSEDKKHKLEEIFDEANTKVKRFFSETEGGESLNAGRLMRIINEYLESFFPEKDTSQANMSISGGDLSDILHRLELTFGDYPAGLGSLNLLYIAAELLLLQSVETHGLRLALIEELEAHLHPQAQLRLIHFLQEEFRDRGQLILTTHSTTLGASIDLKKLIICKRKRVFPMGPDFTELEVKNYKFLQRFLDATKANLFFSRGLILVEGDAENLLLPAIAKIIDRPLHRYGVSIVNVGSTAFLHYAKIFHRKDSQAMGIKVAVITDLDVKPLEFYKKKGETKSVKDIEREKNEKRLNLEERFKKGDVKVFISPNWTLEYEIAFSCLNKVFYRSLLWAEKKQNAKTGVPQKNKKKEVRGQCNQKFEEWGKEWQGSNRKEEKIAYEMYKKTMVDKEISKAITAQVFGENLEKLARLSPKKAKKQLLQATTIRYLIEAICHVTEPLEEETSGSD